jgi:hypothetical protein
MVGITAVLISAGSISQFDERRKDYEMDAIRRSSSAAPR